MRPGYLLLALAMAWSQAAAQGAIEPVQRVSPSSTLGEIQSALDNGGTVVFEPGDYYQVASATPGMPPPTPAAAKGFNIGQYGKDVRVLGVTGPGGARPRIHGGNVVFRVGAASPVPGKAVSFRIENLEIDRPDLGGKNVLYSRVGILVANALGPNSVVSRCKFTINGSSSDTGAAASHSAAIWFMMQMAAQSVSSGARIEISDNEIAGGSILAGIVLGHFRPETAVYAAPRLVIRGNTLEVSLLRGMGAGGAAIYLAGGWPNSSVSGNVIRGDGHAPGFAGSAAIAYGAINELPSSDIAIDGNDSTGFVGDYQLSLARTVASGEVTLNSFGPAAVVGAMSWARGVRFQGNHFYGEYPGWTPSEDGTTPLGGPGLFWLAQTAGQTTGGSALISTKLNGPPHGFDFCSQIFDDSDTAGTPDYDGANTIPGYPRCVGKTADFFRRMQDLKSSLEPPCREYWPPTIWQE